MAVITRIELVNYLCEGWQPSMGAARWRPLWPANTIRLAGQSTAIQIPNGSGKTSVTDAILFLLSRDRQLKKGFIDRCAPAEAGYSHVRIEFALKTDENITQRELITLDPRDCPAQLYVIGVCANRGDEQLQFYRYPGPLEAAPAYLVEGSTIVFTPNDVFRNRVRNVPKSDWNQWSNVQEWSKAVGEFVSPEVVRQNVIFHRSGAGDASATFNKVTVESGERFDEAYFKQVAAPQLLANLMGESAEEDERTIEDTITISMTRFIDAKLKVERKQTYLLGREAMEAEFAPVLAAGDAIEQAESGYHKQLRGLGSDVALLERFAGQGDAAFPGVPLDPTDANVPVEIKRYLASMALDKDGSVIVTDDALAQMLGLTTGRLNELAGRGSVTRAPVAAHPASAQLIDFNCDIKFSDGYGGRRKAVKYYDQRAALELAARREGGAGLEVETLRSTFEAAEQRVDSNMFRIEHRRLTSRRDELKAAITAAEKAGRQAEERQRELEAQVTQRAENHAAYQEFCQCASLLPDTLRDSPRDAEQWYLHEIDLRYEAITCHSQRIGELTSGWQTWLQVRQALGLQPPADRLLELENQKQKYREQKEAAYSASQTAQNRYRDHSAVLDRSRQQLTTLQIALAELKALLPLDITFRQIFGDVDPLLVFPPIEPLKVLRQSLREKSDSREPLRALHGRLVVLSAANEFFRGLFGEVDPSTATPQADRDQLYQARHVAELILSQHAPLADALEKHFLRHAIDPGDWLRNTDVALEQAQRDAQAALNCSEDLQREIAALDDLTLMDDTEYAEALDTLTTAGISFVRLRDFIFENEPHKERALSLLSAFAPLLSAPVLADLAVVELAMQALQSKGHEIPLLLRDPLLAELHSNTVIETTSGAAVAFLAGVQTRRVRALLDPQALEEEKCDLNNQLLYQESLREQALAQANMHSPHTDDYRQVVLAQDAQRLDSVAKSRSAQEQLLALVSHLDRANALTTDEALQSLAGAEEFQRLGGKLALNKLTEDILVLSESIASIDQSIVTLEQRTTSEALLAHDGAVKFARSGGITRMAELTKDADDVNVECQEREAQLVALASVVTEALASDNRASQQEQDFLLSFALQSRELTAVITFESEGHVVFMENRQQMTTELEQARDDLRSLGRVSFDRAQIYKDHEGEDDQELQRRIAETARARDEAAVTVRAKTKDFEHTEGLLIGAIRDAEALHELAYMLIVKRSAVAPFLPDLLQLEGGASPAEAHPLYARLDELRHQLMEPRRSATGIDRTTISELRAEVEDINIGISGQEVRDAKKRTSRARDQFQLLRDAFCRRAAGNEKPVLSQAEIEAIQAANTVEQLHELVRLGDRLRADLEREHAELQELQASVSAVESESIDTLTRLVESCRSNLITMNKVMARNPNARFFLEATIISSDDIKRLMIELRDGIEDRKRRAESSTTLIRRHRDDDSIRQEVRRALIDRIFTEPSVQFRHIGMFEGESKYINSTLSEGQKAALQMMWLIKESEYHLECAIRRHLGGGSKKKLRERSQRILFFDGLFSNLSDRALIDEAFKGLGEADSNLQLIGLIHNPEYRNNAKIFPSLVIGRRAGWRQVDGERSFIRFEDGRPEGSIGLATIIVAPTEQRDNGLPNG